MQGGDTITVSYLMAYSTVGMTQRVKNNCFHAFFDFLTTLVGIFVTCRPLHAGIHTGQVVAEYIFVFSDSLVLIEQILTVND